MVISDDSFQIQKKSDVLYKPCSVYSVCPLNGRSCFGVEISVVSSRPVGRLMIGVYRVPKNCPLSRFNQSSLPYESSNYCVWHNSAVWNNFSVIHTKMSYGSVHLSTMKPGDKVGFTITLAGDLAFFVNDECQGLAARNIYLESCDLYAVATLLESCDSVSVVKSGMRMLHDR